MKRSDLAILIPAFNESKTICSVIKKVEEYGIPIVIDDGSSDDTFVLAKNAGAIVIKHEINLGYDKTLNNGFIIALRNKFKYAITFDADDQHDHKIISSFINLLDKGNSVVCGVRQKKQRISEVLFSIYTNLRWGIKDPLCGMKGYSLNLYEDLGYFDSYNSVGTELLLFALKKNYKFNQVSISTKSREDLPRFGSSIKGNIYCINNPELKPFGYFKASEFDTYSLKNININ